MFPIQLGLKASSAPEQVASRQNIIQMFLNFLQAKLIIQLIV